MIDINKLIMKIVNRTIIDNKMINDEGLILLGVSGGSDSMALLDIMYKLYDERIIVAHLNHKFRGEEAKKDAQFVKEECKKRNIKSVIEEYDVPQFIEETGLGVQEAARKVRYQFYLRTARQYNAKYLALGHHKDDQAETILMRLLRGSGVQGLSGIAYVRQLEEISVIRPLLDLTKKNLENYCEKNNISYRIDRSNLSTKYFRNELRLEIIPFLEKYNSNLSNNLYQLGRILQEEDKYLEKVSREYLNEITLFRDENMIKVNNQKLKKLDIALQRRLIHLILRYLNFKQEKTFQHIENVRKLMIQSHPSKSLDLPNVLVYRNYEELAFTIKINNRLEPYSYTVGFNDQVIVDNIGKLIKTYVLDEYIKQKGVYAVFDIDKLTNTKLVIRSKENGDKIKIKGMNGTKKVKDVFIDQKIPRNDRYQLPMIVQDDKILWIPGIKRSHHALVEKYTKKFLYVIVEDI